MYKIIRTMALMFGVLPQRGWREETYDVRGPDYSAEPLFKIERSATPILGIRSGWNHKKYL